MVDKETKKRILSDYKKMRDTYEDFVDKLEQLLYEVLNERGIVVHSIGGRAKNKKSLTGKLSREKSNYRSLNEITDLAGLRITTYFADDVDRIADIIRQEFEIDVKNSIDKRNALEADRFGYLSLHHVFTLKEGRCSLPEYRAFRDLKAEVQIRSILQHAWAEIEHDLGYKSEIEIPQPIRRRFALVAGLLEIADREFDGIKSDLEAYRNSMPQAIKDTPEEVSLNLDSLNALLQTDTIRQFDEAILNVMEEAIKVGLELRPITENIAISLLEDMRLMGMQTINDIVTALNNRRKTILSFAKYWADKAQTFIPVGSCIYQLWLIYYVYKDGIDLAERLDQLNFGSSTYLANELAEAIRQVRAELGADVLIL